MPKKRSRRKCRDTTSKQYYIATRKYYMGVKELKQTRTLPSTKRVKAYDKTCNSPTLYIVKRGYKTYKTIIPQK